MASGKLGIVPRLQERRQVGTSSVVVLIGDASRLTERRLMFRRRSWSHIEQGVSSVDGEARIGTRRRGRTRC